MQIRSSISGKSGAGRKELLDFLGVRSLFQARKASGESDRKTAPSKRG